MAFSYSFPCGLELRRYAAELHEITGGGFLRKIYQTPAGVFSFRIHHHKWSGWLAFSSLPEIPCLFVGEDRPDASPDDESVRPREPSALCRLLRGKLEGNRIDRVRQVSGDRIIEITTSGRGRENKLVFELLGRFTNLLLVSPDGRIDACLRKESRRRIQAGEVYRPPESPAKVAYDSPEAGQLLDQLAPVESMAGENVEPDRMAAGICSRIAGLSPVLAGECLRRARRTGEAASAALSAIIDEATAANAPVHVYLDSAGRCVLVSPVRMTHLEQQYRRTEFPSFLDAMGRWYRDSYDDWELEQLRAELTRCLNDTRRKLRRDRDAARRDLAEGRREDEFRVAAEMILAQPDRVSKGTKEVCLDNLYDSPPTKIRVALDPQLTPQENATRYFQRASKARRKCEHARRREESLGKALACLENLMRMVEAAESVHELRELEKRGQEITGPRAKVRTRKEKGREPPDPVRRIARVFSTVTGHTVYVARGAREGDDLLRRFARGSDLWLHTRDVPGSHVILRREQKQEKIPEEALLDAAHLAVHFSKAKGETVVPLHLTEVKNLRRPRCGAPGKVIISRDRTFTVRIEKDRLDRLLAR